MDPLYWITSKGGPYHRCSTSFFAKSSIDFQKKNIIKYKI